jgi:hypothetical protein
LKPRRHSVRECPEAKVCTEDGCSYRHHKLLHKTIDNNTNTTPTQNNETETLGVNTENESQSRHQALFKILPVTLYGNGVRMETFAFLDDGSSATLLDTSVAKKLKLKGPNDPLCIKWTKGVHKVEKNSIRTSLKIRGFGTNTIYNIKNVRTISNLDLPEQSVDAQSLQSQHPHLLDVPLQNLKKVKPQILIGLEHAFL